MKKKSFPKFKSKPKNSSSSKRNNAYNLDKLLKPYKDFVKKISKIINLISKIKTKIKNRNNFLIKIQIKTMIFLIIK